jgi:hypothetical protein
MANVPLQQRAGRNIGIEPNLASAFLQDASGPETDVNTATNAKTTILECPEGMARAPQQAGFDQRAGMIINRSAADFDYLVLFVDDLGNEIILSGSSVAANSAEGFSYTGTNLILAENLVLNPGEKIVLQQGSVG